MTYKVYRDAGTCPSMCGLIVPDDGRDTDAVAREHFGAFKMIKAIDSVDGFEAIEGMPDCFTCYFY
jgi:hypothetical protein